MATKTFTSDNDKQTFHGRLGHFQSIEGVVHPEDLVEIVNHNLTEAVFRCTFDGRILYVNDAFLRLFGATSHGEVLGKYTRIFYRDNQKPKEINQSLTNDRSSFQGDIEFVTLQGQPFHGHLSTRRVHRNSTIFIDGVIRDITSEIESENRMKRQLEVQEILLEISGSFLNADLDKIDEVIFYSLGQMATYFDVDRVQVHDYNFKSQLCITSYEWKRGAAHVAKPEHPPVPLRLLAQLVHMHEQGKHIFLESISDLPDGEIKEFLLAEGILSSLTIPMIFENVCVGFIAFDSISKPAAPYSSSIVSFLKLFANMVANIASRGKSHAMLKQLVEKVTIQAKKHRDFSFITSHNIRASSANLQAISELLSEDYRGRYLEMLTSTIARLNESVTNINHILNLENDALLRRTSCDVIVTIEQMLEYEKKGRFHGVQFILDTSGVKVASIYALPGYLENILMQIISNAIKYGINERNPQIEISLVNQDGWLELAIEDFGNGFDYETHAGQVFEVGSRFHRNNCDGQGLGLYIAKQQMESLQGNIDIFSEVNKGTRVTLKFPIATEG